jgi:Fucosyltransferase, N-terminal
MAGVVLIFDDPKYSKETRTTKRILFWTTFFGVVDFYVGLGRIGFKNCPVSDCETTNQRQLLSDSDAIIFHGRDLNRLDLPNIRSADQRWIFLLYESPLNTPDFIAYFNDMFNWTMTYRLSIS